MRRSLALLLSFFCIKVCFFVTLATQFLGGVVEKYNAELRKNLSNEFVVDPKWNPNVLLVKDWAPVLSSYPEVKGRRLARETFDAPEATETEDNLDFRLPIQAAPIDLPIRPAAQQ
ncbi:hypothetical protein [Comamonas thiooxydans]|uniref:hypothetical protein n=1 Tax=Comamonas thiooxydans TaxID=363952 RepID=UPI000551FA97|nr:hypothetical protein [Comamonas thiooxydans]